MQSLFGHPSFSAEGNSTRSLGGGLGSGSSASTLRPPVPERAARRLLCPAVFSYAKLTKWPGSMAHLRRDRKYGEVALRRLNGVLENVGLLRAQRIGVVESPFCELCLFESPADSSSGLEAKFSAADALKVGALVWSQLNAIVRAAREPVVETETAGSGEEAPGPGASGEEFLPRSAASDGEAEKDRPSLDGEAEKASPPGSVSVEPPAPPLARVEGAERYILYLHGGAYIAQSPFFYRMFFHGECSLASPGASCECQGVKTKR